MSKLRWRDYAGAVSVQPPLIAPADLPVQPKRRRPGAARKPEPLEQDIKTIIAHALRLHKDVRQDSVEITGVYRGSVIRSNGSKGYVSAGRNGMADISAKMIDGRRISIEVKRPGARNNLSPAQREYLADEIRRGDLAGVATSVEEAFAIVEGRA